MKRRNERMARLIQLLDEGGYQVQELLTTASGNEKHIDLSSGQIAVIVLFEGCGDQDESDETIAPL